MSLILKLIICTIGSLQICASNNTTFKELTPVTCTCPGDVLTYECVIAGSGATVWKGSGFTDCPSQSQGNQIVLLHSQFMTEGDCNGGSVVAEGIDTGNGNCYRSQLNVTVNVLLNNTNVTCIHDNFPHQEIIGNSTIRISGPPERTVVTLMDANSTHLTFNVSLSRPVDLSCSRFSYNIEASNCGSCPNNTTSITITCSNFTTSVETNVCNLSVGGVMCGNMAGDRGSVLTNLRVPSAPAIESQPVYLQERQEILAELITSFNVVDTFNVSNTTTVADVSAINYTIVYSDSTSGRNCSQLPISIPSKSCVNGICSHVFDVLSSSDCPASTDIVTTVFASNVLGDGPPSNSIISGANNFVHVSYNSETNRLNCTFFNLPSDYPKQCIANITYGTNCDQHLPGSYTNTSTGDYVTTPQLERISDVSEYCYTVVASSGSLSATIRGRIVVSIIEVDIIKTLIVATIVPFVAVIILVLVTVFILLLYYWKIRKLDYTIKISIPNNVESHIEVFKVFEDLGTNINGFNTHLHHENLQEMRKLVDLPDHSIYHMHCECSTETTAESLKDTLCNKLIPDDLENSLREKLIANVEVMDSHTHGNDELKLVLVKFPIEDKCGSLHRTMKNFQDLHDIKLQVVGINNLSTWDLSDSPGFCDSYVKFSSSRAKKRQIINKLGTIQGSGTEQVKPEVIDEKTHVEEPMKQVIEILVEDSPGTLADALKVFNDEELGRNITRINAANPGNALKTIRVKCSCKQQLQAEIEIELDRHKAINIDILLAQSLADVDEQQYIIYTVTYSVFNKRGSLRNSLKAFEELGINIDTINPHTDDGGVHVHRRPNYYQKNEVEFKSTDEEAERLVDHMQRNTKAFVKLLRE